MSNNRVAAASAPAVVMTREIFDALPQAQKAMVDGKWHVLDRGLLRPIEIGTLIFED